MADELDVSLRHPFSSADLSVFERLLDSLTTVLDATSVDNYTTGQED